MMLVRESFLQPRSEENLLFSIPCIKFTKFSTLVPGTVIDLT